MITNVLKLKLSQWAAVLLISIPLGIFIYTKNIDKISYLGFIKAAKLITENYCNTAKVSAPPALLTQDDIAIIEAGLRLEYTSYDTRYKAEPSLGYLKDRAVYQLNIGGRAGDLELMKRIGALAKISINAAEKKSYYEQYESIRLRCDSVVMPLYKYVNPEGIHDYFEVRSSYKKFNVYLASISPLIFLYLLLVCYNYLQRNIASLRKTL